MRRVAMTERADWRETATRMGFHFHSDEGKPYWDETAAYAFSLKEIEEDIEAPIGELEQICLAFVDRAAKDEEILRRLAIPDFAWPLIAESWQRGDRNLYGRFDLAYDGTGPAKLLEYNADTPTTLFETGVFQWLWLEDQIARGALPKDADQFNSVHDRLVEALKGLKRGEPYRLHLACTAASEEDRATIAYLGECARQAKVAAHCLDMEAIGITEDGQFSDDQDEPIETLFKLYPWEWMLREDFGRRIAGSRTQFIEPIWKCLLSTKGLLPYLHEMVPDHPNILPCFFEGDPRAATLTEHVRKPLLSREGANVTIRAAGISAASDGPYGREGAVIQAYAPLFRHGASQAVVGAWVVASTPAGLCIREENGPIIGNGARFLPHYIEP